METSTIETTEETKPKRVKHGGRKKGTPNLITTDIRDRLKTILTGQLENLEADLAEMRPAQRWETISGLMKYAVPALSATKVEADVESKGDIKITIAYAGGD